MHCQNLLGILESISCAAGEKLSAVLALLVPVSGVWSVGQHVAGAASLAVAHVNAQETLLPGYELEYKFADSGCSAKQGLEAMGKLLASDHMRAAHSTAVIGPACSSACEVTSYLSSGQGIAQISWGWCESICTHQCIVYAVIVC